LKGMHFFIAYIHILIILLFDVTACVGFDLSLIHHNFISNIPAGLAEKAYPISFFVGPLLPSQFMMINHTTITRKSYKSLLV